MSKLSIAATGKDATPNASKFDVFISYSRHDGAFVKQLYDALGEKECRAWVDWKGIPPTADWMAELFAAIESADNFVFVLTDKSAASENCGREVDHAVKCRKRLIPLVWGKVEGDKVRPDLRRLNWIICADDEQFPSASASLVEALTTNLEWVREHTRLLVRAVDWRDGAADASLLLRGSDLREAEQWLARGADEEPKPTELHRDYIIASRTQETRRGRRTLSVVVAGLILAIGLAVVAWVQRQEAQRQRTVAEQRREEAEQRRIEAERQSLTALTNESNASLSLGREIEALVATVKAGKKLQQEAKLLDDAGSVYRTLVALRRAVYQGRERNRIASGHLRGVTHLSFSPDDQSLYTVGGEGDIRHWGIDGRLLSSFETEHNGMGDGCTSIQNFAISPDGKVLATLGNEGGFALWSASGVRTGQFDLQVAGGGDGMCTGVRDSAINFASKTVTVRDDEQKAVWSFGGRLMTSTPVEPTGDDGRGKRAVTSADKSLVAETDDDNTVRVRRRGGAEALTLRLQRSPAFSHGSRRLATVSGDVDDSIIHLWDLTLPASSPPDATKAQNTPAPKKTLQLGARKVALDQTEAVGSTEGVASPDGRFAAVVGGDNGERLEIWRLAEAAGGSATRVAEFDTDQIASADFSEALASLSFSPDSQMLASGGSNGTVNFWSMDGKRVRQLVAHSSMTNARFSPDGRLLLTWGDSRDGEVAVKLWTADGELLDSLSRERVTDAWFSTDSRWILATGEESQKLAWSLDLDHLLREGCNLLSLYLANPATDEKGGLCS